MQEASCLLRLELFLEIRYKNMTHQKAQDIRKWGDGELRTLVGEQRAKIVELTVKKHTAGIKNVRETKDLRKYIARILTVLGERAK